MVQTNLNPDFALSADLKDLKDRISRQEQVDLNVAGLHDVAILSSPITNQALVWNSTAQRWVNANIASTALSGVVPVANGGTNISSYATGDVLVASAPGVLTSLPDTASGNALLSGGVGVVPSYGKVGLTTHVSGTLPVANGGTGAATFTSGAYLKGAGTSAIASQTGIPIADVSGSLPIAQGGTGVTTGAGLVPVVPSSVAVGSGTGSVNAAGLVTFTGASSISVNGVFSALYRNYKILFQAQGAAGYSEVTFRFRIAGTDKALTYYTWGWRAAASAGILVGASNTTGMVTGVLLNSVNANASWSADIFSPNLVATTTGLSAATGFDGTTANHTSVALFMNEAVAYDGLSISPNTTTFTGTLKVYGYN